MRVAALWLCGCCLALLILARDTGAFASSDSERYSAEQVIHEIARIPRPKRRVALVLSGGGAGGCYQAGVIKSLTEALDEHNHRTGDDLWFDIVAGTSAGCLNGVLIARGPDPAQWLWKFPPQERAYFRGRGSVWDVVTPDRVMAMHSHKPYFPIDLQLYLFKYSKNNPRYVVWLLTLLLILGLVYLFLPAVMRMLSGDLSAVCFIVGGVLATTLLTSLLTSGIVAGGFLLIGQFVLARGIHLAVPRDEFHPLLRLLMAPFIALIALASAGVVVVPWLLYQVAPELTYWLTVHRRFGWWATFVFLAVLWTPALWWWSGLAVVHRFITLSPDASTFERRFQAFGGHSATLLRWWLQRSGVVTKTPAPAAARAVFAPLGLWIDGATSVAGRRVQDLPDLYGVYRRYSTFSRILQRRVMRHGWAQRTVSVIFLAILFAVSTATVMFVGTSQQQGLFSARPLDRFLTEILGRMVGVTIPARWEELDTVAPEVGRKVLDGMRSDLVIATTDIVKRRADFFYRARPGSPLGQVKRDNWIALDNGNEKLLIDAMKASASVFPLFPPVAIEKLLLIDGGFLHYAPVRAAVDVAKARQVIVVYCAPMEKDKPLDPGYFSSVAASLELLYEQSQSEDDPAILVNEAKRDQRELTIYKLWPKERDIGLVDFDGHFGYPDTKRNFMRQGELDANKQLGGEGFARHATGKAH